jgi:hypothetical protein
METNNLVNYVRVTLNLRAGPLTLWALKTDPENGILLYQQVGEDGGPIPGQHARLYAVSPDKVVNDEPTTFNRSTHKLEVMLQ